MNKLMLPSIKSCNGSLLVETLLATVILSVSLSLIIQSLSMSLRAIQYGSDYILASVVLQSQLADAQLPQESPNEENMINKFTSNVTRQPLNFLKPGAAYYLENVEINLAWGEIKKRNISIETYVLKAYQQNTGEPLHGIQ